MAEGLTMSTGQSGAAVHDDPGRPPAPDADAPRGWTWNRKAREWRPKVRGRVLYAAGQPERPADPAPDTGSEADTYRDPPPSWADEPSPSVEEQWKPDAESRKDIKALVALCYTVPAETLPLIDPYCWGPLAEKQTATGVIDAVSEIVCESPRVAKWALSKAGLIPWVKLGIALKPVGVNFLHHHITKSVEVEVDREAMTMTVTENDWTKYPAA